jgi:hypothetical protein
MEAESFHKQLGVVCVISCNGLLKDWRDAVRVMIYLQWPFVGG